jgi:hypothetical protein
VIGGLLALFGALAALALICRARPPAVATPLLAFFGIDAEPSVGAGDVLGIAGASGAIFVLLLERAGWPFDGVLALDCVLSAAGAGLGLTWLVARAAPGEAGEAPSAAPVEGPRPMETELDPRGS